VRVFENSVLRIFGPKMGEGYWRKLHNDELHRLYSSPNIVRANKWRRMRWEGHVARIGRRELFAGFWLGDPKGRDFGNTLSLVGR
jgi:hypothetical protein